MQTSNGHDGNPTHGSMIKIVMVIICELMNLN